MTDDTGSDRAEPHPPPRAKSTLHGLLRRIWAGALANRGLVGAVILLGLLEAFFTKAPLLLVKFLMDALTGGSEWKLDPIGPASLPPGLAPPLQFPDAWDFVPPEEPSTIGEWAKSAQDSLEVTFFQFAAWVSDLLGLGLAADDRMLVFVGCAVAAAIMGTLGSLAIYGMTVWSRYFAAKIVVDIRNEVLEHVLRLPMRFFAKRRMGDLISNITTDTAVLTRSFTLVCNNAVTDPLSILFNFVLLLIWVPEISWILLIAAPLMALPMLRTGKRIHKSSSRSLAAMGDSTESMNQMLTGIRTVKSFQLEEERLQDYQDSNSNYLRRTKRMLKAKGFSQGFLFATYQIAFAALLCVMGWLVIEKGYSISVITMAILPLATTYQHVKRVVRSYNILCESVGAMEGIESILGVGADAAHCGTGQVVAELRGEVEMEAVSFAYDKENVLDDFSFRANPGQTVAFVGPTGAGKSTAIDLIARFYDPTAGRVLIDGVDLCDLDLHSYRRHLAMVSQTPFLFNTSILENIRYGRRDATEEEIHEAARQAYIHDFIVSQPHGYRTVVGEQGSNLSGGQRQRITIARAILRDPSILFLDEATSALDSETEKDVQGALDNLMQGRTSFVIAHRLPTIKSADLIIVLERGRLVEEGTHDELVQKGGLYSRMYELQQL